MNVFVEILNGIGRLLLQPALYVGILLVIMAGFNRVKWERKSFSISIYSPWLELKNFFGLSLLFGLAISVVTALIGFGVMIEWVAIFNAVACFLLIAGMFRLSSTAFTIGITSLIFYFCYYFDIDLAPFKNAALTYDALYIDNFMVSMTFLLAILLFIEAFLIQYTSAKNPSPSLRKSKRGKLVGSYQLRKLWFVPIVMFIPGDVFTKIFEWWPVFAIGSHSYSLIILPLFIGFQQQVQGQFPEEASRKTAMQVTTLATIIAVAGLVGIVMPVLTLFAFMFAVIGRFWISYSQYRAEKLLPKKFGPQPDGLVILGARAATPSARLNLKAGEKITEVNGQPVHTREELYEALNLNRAFCKLKVIDNDGEPRFEQTALYENESFELGLLLVEPR
ncbi:S1C family serine protease [Listeria cossartiae subsp. cayugensis]|uniref:S1C family serine protease n=1 Tax=Listeria cossartiae TaxID=2838249 RepID=UPI00288099C3|nr:S1C family serine protease [Listeria cossartiae]MDT0004375.1 S1C family serine protease [Listeria cossartiae subsp. cayugensis]MDT0020784.1 S1C family serine protease [Listeria cossartiae subsp. cayugensis]MDT0037002.1 S1C family serine protease [Listeria cossartiae subsp. cayugensis]MDT0042520.1 S1C family serine protease [Listeria cossartiae subsp. cayugensis]MDT0047891.1 S1C family serine protease [Listeria cossartiae subsp. cayugensis]